MAYKKGETYLPKLHGPIRNDFWNYLKLPDQILLRDLQSQSRLTNFVLGLCADTTEAVTHL